MGGKQFPLLLMATFKSYEGKYGWLTLIYDTALYNYVSALTSDTIVFENDVTTEGEQFFNIFNYSGQIKSTFGYNLANGEYDYTALLTVIRNILPNATTFDIMVTGSDLREPFVDGGTGSIVTFLASQSYGRMLNCISDGTNNYLIAPNNYGFPYGYLQISSWSRQAYITLLVYNDDGSNSTCFQINCSELANRITISKPSLMPSFTTYFPVWIGNIQPWSDTDDPFKPGGHSIHGGGGRSFDDSSDPVSLPVPAGDPVLNSGFLTMYQVNANKLNDLASFMWNTSLFDVETWQKIMANPFDAIISLNCIPASPSVLSDRKIKIGNVVTSVSAPVVADQFVQIQCGTLDVEEYSGSYLDYSPYTKIEIYLPYIGFREMNTDEIMDKTLTLVYNIDVVSGACVANIMVDNTVLYQFDGNCAMQIPITGRDPAKTLSSVIGVITSAGSLAGGAILGTLNPQSAVKAVTATAESVIGGKRNIQRSGNISGSAGFMGGQTPYLIITRPRQALPEEQNLYMGYPSFITSLLGDLSGMTVIADCHLENIPCTDGELQEIERLLKEGVIL